MLHRPRSLTIIGRFVIVSSAFILLTGGSPTRNSDAIEAMISRGALPVWIHAAVGAVGGLLGLACGWGILKGWNWARFVYVATLIAGIAFRVAMRPSYPMLLFSLAFLFAAALVLFRSVADEWFASGA